MKYIFRDSKKKTIVGYVGKIRDVENAKDPIVGAWIMNRNKKLLLFDEQRKNKNEDRKSVV
jgi:hypothetical protein